MNTDLKIAAAYIRVSTDRQTELSPDSQIKVVKDYARANGYIIPQEYIFRDDGISGRRADKRPAFNEMIAAAKQKPSPFSAIMVWKYSRFARNQEEAIVYKSMLKKNNVSVISCSETLDDSPYSSLIERIIEWMDEYYSIRLSGEVKRGMQEKVERGQAVAIPSFGYNIIDKKYIINKATAPYVRKIFSDYITGKGSTAIARELNALGVRTTRGNKWENRTVEYILSNPVYIGKIRWNPTGKTQRDFNDENILLVDGIHEPIIDKETFNKAQRLIAQNKKYYSKYTHSAVSQDYMLHGLVKCSDCGASMSMSAKGKGLQCVKYIHGLCNVSHYISLNRINELFLTALEYTFKSGNINLSVHKYAFAGEANYIDYDALIERENKKLQRVKEAYAEGVYTIDELRESKDSIETQIKKLQERKEKLSTENSKEKIQKQLVWKDINILEKLRSDTVTEKEKNELLKGFIDKIVFDRTNGKIQIYFYA